MKSFWTRPERLLDALVIGLAVPTIAIAVSVARHDDPQERAGTLGVTAAGCDGIVRTAWNACVSAVQSGKETEANDSPRLAVGATRDDAGMHGPRNEALARCNSEALAATQACRAHAPAPDGR